MPTRPQANSSSRFAHHHFHHDITANGHWFWVGCHRIPNLLSSCLVLSPPQKSKLENLRTNGNKRETLYTVYIYIYTIYKKNNRNTYKIIQIKTFHLKLVTFFHLFFVRQGHGRWQSSWFTWPSSGVGNGYLFAAENQEVHGKTLPMIEKRFNNSL